MHTVANRITRPAPRRRTVSRPTRITDVSVIIPTCGRPTKLQNCLAALAQQRLPANVAFETVVAVDGANAADDYAAHDAPARTQFLPLSRCGIGAARNTAVAASAGELLIVTNDDTYAQPDWVAQHVAAHHERGRPGLVVGLTRFCEWPAPTVFDALARDTSLLFFYDQMEPKRTYGFRHAFGCNTSVPRTLFDRVGGYDERLRPYGYEDLELAYRVEQSGYPGVFYQASALNTHDHRMTWPDYCRRETCLGRMAACLAAVNPDCFEAIFRTRDAEALRDRFAAWLELDRGDHAAAAAEFESWADRPVAQIAAWPAMRTALLRLLQPVKRRCFREGFVSGFHLRFDASWGERLALGHSFP